MKLAVLDIDGTLTRTQEVDSRCFAAAFAEALGLAELGTDWSPFRHHTDSGIAAELYERHRGRPPSAAELAAVKACFFELLRAAARQPEGFAATPGAPELLDRLPAEGWGAALATGCWRPSAQLKLRAAGLDRGLPLATADEIVSREEIVAAAVAEAALFYGVDGFERIVSVGDGLWDLETARNRALPFVGIAGGEAARKLRERGASHVLADFSRPAAVTAALERARVPTMRRGLV